MFGDALAGGIEAVQTAINDHGTFGEYLRAVLVSRPMAQFGVLVLFGTLGMAANYLWKWLRDEITGSLWAYLTKQYPKRTALAYATFIGYAVTTVLSPVLDGAGWGVVINLGLTTGFAIDALVNKSKAKVWTDEEREARKDPEQTLPPKKEHT